MTRRAHNFSIQEVEKLVDLVEEHKQIIENKQTDRITSQQKEDTWKRIEVAFNASSEGIFRNAKTLKMKYENLKRNTKEKKSICRDELYKTGGGSQAIPPVNSIDNKILGICQAAQISGNTSSYDNDRLESDLADMIGEEEEVEVLSISKEKDPQTNSWSKWKPSMLKQKQHDALHTKKPRENLEKNTAWHEVATLKKQKIEIEIKQLEERHELEKKKLLNEIVHEEEIHELEIKKLNIMLQKLT